MYWHHRKEVSTQLVVVVEHADDCEEPHHENPLLLGFHQLVQVGAKHLWLLHSQILSHQHWCLLQ